MKYIKMLLFKKESFVHRNSDCDAEIKLCMISLAVLVGFGVIFTLVCEL